MEQSIIGVVVLQGGECSLNSASSVFSRTHYHLQSPLVLRAAVAEQGRRQDAVRILSNTPA